MFSSLYDSCGHFQHSFLSFMSTSPLPVFCELYFFVGVHWLISQNQQYCKMQQIFLEEQKEHVRQFIHASPFFLSKSKWPHSDNKAEICQIHLLCQVFWNTEVLIWKSHQQTNGNMIMHIGKVKKTLVIWIIFFYYIINSLIPKQRFVLKCFMKISMKYYPVITEKAIRE